MSFDWYPFYPVHWKRDTLQLTLAEEGAYRRLNDEYMTSGGPLPDDDSALARLIGVSMEEWLAVAPKVRAFYHRSHGKLAHKRCEKELHAQAMQAHSTSMRSRAAANARWEQHRKTKALMSNNNDAPALLAQSARNASEMRNDATLQDTTITSSSSVAAREKAKRPAALSRQELDAKFAARRS